MDDMHSSESGEPLPVRVTGLTKVFATGNGELTALGDATFSLAAGKMLAVIGASGSGKSTLLHLVAGLTSLTRGQVVVAGTDLSQLNDRKLTLFRRRHLGLIFQAYNLVPTLDVEDNLRLPLLMERGATVDPDRITTLLQTLGLADRRHHRPDQLSGGEQQRVAIGRALITDPSVILADEPTGNLDSRNAQKFCRLLRDIATNQKRAVIVVTHDPAVAAWADGVLVLKDGRILRKLSSSDYGSARELADRFMALTEEPTGGDQ